MHAGWHYSMISKGKGLAKAETMVIFKYYAFY